MRDAVDLYELQNALKEGIQGLFPSYIWMRSELSSVQVKSNGHCYLELSQSDGNGVVAKARAVIWRSAYSRISARFAEATGDRLKPGMTILARTTVSYSELYGLSLIIDDVEPEFSLGEAELRRRKTMQRLEQEGLMSMQKELCLPALPYRLAVISARDAAGYGDFCRQLETNEYGFRYDITLYEASMQGESAPVSVASALERIASDSQTIHFDAVLIMRGGGSKLDLACFDEWEMCRAIALCPLPVMTAIGHDRDVSVSDMVACVSVKTPTALAAFLIDAFAEEDERISTYGTRLKLAFNNRISLMDRDVDRRVSRLRAAVSESLLRMEHRLDELQSRISRADPEAVLSRGYALVSDSGGVVRKSVEPFSEGDTLEVILSDGKLECIVKNKKYGRKV